MVFPRRILTVLGTRPEAIKLFPVLHALAGDARFISRTCVTGQHRTMLDRVLECERPDWVLVQGDTATAMCGALAGYYRQIPLAHVEAGLRTGVIGRPW